MEEFPSQSDTSHLPTPKISIYRRKEWKMKPHARSPPQYKKQYISHSIRNSQSPIRPVSVPGSPSKATTHLASATPRDPENEKTATAAARNSHISVISLHSHLLPSFLLLFNVFINVDRFCKVVLPGFQNTWGKTTINFLRIKLNASKM